MMRCAAGTAEGQDISRVERVEWSRAAECDESHGAGLRADEEEDERESEETVAAPAAGERVSR